MQDQGKRLLVAVALALVVMLVWTQFVKKPESPKPKEGSGAQVTVTSKPLVTDGSLCSHSKVETFRYPMLVAQLSSCGGTLVGWLLADPRYVEDATHGELVRTGPSPATPDELGDFALNFVDADNREIVPANAQWEGRRLGDRQMEYRLDDGDTHLVKTFTIYPDDYMISMSYSGASAGKGQLVPTVSVFGWQDPESDTSKNGRVQPRVWQSTTYRRGAKVATADLDIGGMDGQPRTEKDVQYTGFEHPYLMTVFAPHLAPEDVTKRTRADTTGAMRTDIELKSVTAGSLNPHEVVGYLGPKSFDMLEHADDVAKFDTGFKETLDFGRLPLIGVSLSIIGRPLLWLLGKLYGVVGNWGISIILLTVIVKLLTLFWTTRSMRSMKAMAAVAPQVQEIQKKCGDDKQRAQAETMALYKQNNIRPLAGCAPMFLQVPIWSALYIMLSVAGEFYLQPFIPGWIDDLSATDPYYVLPVALFILYFVQMRLTPQNSAQPGQKMMQYGMPIMFGIFAFYFPAGLTIYMITNTILSSIHSIYMNRYDKKSLEMIALLKKNKAAVEARAKAEEETKAKASEKRGKATLKVVDADGVEKSGAVAQETAKREEVSSDEGDDDDNDDDSTSALATTGTSGGNQVRRSRRKKRRR
jgi:YidC/Oxa1 family membrane protein insertase